MCQIAAATSTDETIDLTALSDDMLRAIADRLLHDLSHYRQGDGRHEPLLRRLGDVCTVANTRGITVAEPT